MSEHTGASQQKVQFILIILSLASFPYMKSSRFLLASVSKVAHTVWAWKKFQTILRPTHEVVFEKLSSEALIQMCMCVCVKHLHCVTPTRLCARCQWEQMNTMSSLFSLSLSLYVSVSLAHSHSNYFSLAVLIFFFNHYVSDGVLSSCPQWDIKTAFFLCMLFCRGKEVVSLHGQNSVASAGLVA